MARKRTLADQVAADLRGDLASGAYPPGSRLPTEADLGQRFGVSRPTIRAALRELEVLGLVSTQHGVGTFVQQPHTVKAGLERMFSITESIRQSGKEPGMLYASRTVRPVMPDEAASMGVATDTQVLELRRTILADGEVVAYSYDLLPMAIIPADLELETLSGSLFSFLRSIDCAPVHGSAEVHAVQSEHVGWGPEAAAHDLFVLLNQAHYDVDDRIVLYSRTYYIEGRFSFTIYR